MTPLETPASARNEVAEHTPRAGRRSGLLVAGAVLLLIVVALSVLLPALSSHDANQIDSSLSFKGPSLAYPVGTDSFGRDVLIRMCAGYRISLVVSIGSVVLGTVVGILLGLVGATFGSVGRLLTMRPLDVLMSFPTIVLAIMVTAILGKGTIVLAVAIAIACVPNIARVMEGAASATERQLYVTAARTRGASSIRLMLHHILPNSIGPVLTQAFLLMGQAALLEAGLSYLGLGVNPPTASLGLMLSQGQEVMSTAPWVVIGPGIGILLLVLAFTFIGSGLQELARPGRRAVRA